MGKHEGYIQLHRNILSWEWYRNPATKIVFLHLLLKANWKQGIFQGIEIPRGSLATSYQSLADDLNISYKEARTAMGHLIETEEIAVKRYSKFSLVAINNYEMYQNPENLGRDLGSKKAEIRAETGAITKQPKNLENKPQNDGCKIESGIVTGREVGNKRAGKGATIEEINNKELNNYNTSKEVVDLFNKICCSFPRVTKISDARKRAIVARLKTYSLDDLKTAFEKAEASDFLKGKNDRNWMANFDWILKDTNLAKIMDGNFDNRKSEVKNKNDEFESRSSVQLW